MSSAWWDTGSWTGHQGRNNYADFEKWPIDDRQTVLASRRSRRQEERLKWKKQTRAASVQTDAIQYTISVSSTIMRKRYINARTLLLLADALAISLSSAVCYSLLVYLLYWPVKEQEDAESKCIEIYRKHHEENACGSNVQ